MDSYRFLICYALVSTAPEGGACHLVVQSQNQMCDICFVFDFSCVVMHRM